jgi:methylated-DNA-protein-cysteine methyltransferase-like protein
MKRADPAYRELVFRIVRRIPKGRVMTYGQIAELLGEGYTPRTVGFVMHGAGDSVPWHRVINARGACSTGSIVLPHDKQQRMLEAEGVTFNAQGCCNLETYLWIPERRKHSRLVSSKQSLFKNKSSARRR